MTQAFQPQTPSYEGEGEWNVTRERLEKELLERSLQLRKFSVELQKKNKELNNLNRLKSEFLANVSHELRSPMSSIQGYASLLLKELKKPTEEQKKYLQRIIQITSDFSQLVGSLINLSQIEAGQIEVIPRPTDLRLLILEVLAQFKPRAADKGLELKREISPLVPSEVMIDSLKVQQILHNLLSNAIKFTDKGSITLKAEWEEEGRFKIWVADTGHGIDPKNHQTIFERFQQVDSSSTREHSGFGLGLTIVKSLVDLLGGEIVVESNLGHGCLFRITLPVTVPMTVPMTVKEKP